MMAYETSKLFHKIHLADQILLSNLCLLIHVHDVVEGKLEAHLEEINFPLFWPRLIWLLFGNFSLVYFLSILGPLKCEFSSERIDYPVLKPSFTFLGMDFPK